MTMTTKTIKVATRMSPAEVRAARKKLGMTRMELATRLGVTYHTVWQWETGTRNITPPTSEALRWIVAFEAPE